MSGAHRETDPGKRRDAARKSRRLWALAAGVWTLVIWGHSLLPAAQSSAESSWVMEAMAPLLALTGLAPDCWHTLVRKLAHMTEFALLGTFWTAALPLSGAGGCSTEKDRACRVLLTCVLIALVDETIQLFVPGRSSQVTDVWIDALGAAIGLGAALLLGKWKRRMER